MTFETVQAALIATLGPALAGQAQVIGYQERARDTDDIEESLSNVTTFYSAGSFPKNANPTLGPEKHDATFKIALLVGAKTKVNLAVLEDETAAPADIQAAIAARLSAELRAEQMMNALWSAIWNCLRLPANRNLGLATIKLSNPWIDNFQKGEIQPRGDVVLMNATCEWGATMMETPVSVTPTPGAGGIQSTLKGTADIAATDPETTDYDSAPLGAEVHP